MPFEPPHFIRSWTELRNNIGAILGSLFLFYVIAASGYVNDAFGCGLNNFIKSHHWARHIIGILTIFLFTNIFTITNLHIIPKVCFAIGLYMVYWFSNKNIATAQLVLICFAVGVYFMQLIRSDNDVRLATDTDLNETDRAEIQKDNDQLAQAQTILLGVGLLLLLIGHLIYVGKKRLEYGMQFSWCELIKGQYPCRGTDRRVYSVYECLAALRKPLSTIVIQEMALNRNLSQDRIKAEINVSQAKETFEDILQENPTQWVDFKVPSGVSFTAVGVEELLNKYFNMKLDTNGSGIGFIVKPDKIQQLAAFNNSGYISGKTALSDRKAEFKNIDKHTLQAIYKAITGKDATKTLLSNYVEGYSDSVTRERLDLVNTLSQQLSADPNAPFSPERVHADINTFNNPAFGVSDIEPPTIATNVTSLINEAPGRFKPATNPYRRGVWETSENAYLLEGSPSSYA